MSRTSAKYSFLNNNHRSRCLPLFHGSYNKQGYAFACALPQSEFQSNDIIYYSTCPSWSRSQNPKPAQNILTEIRVY